MSYACAYSSVQLNKRRVEKEFTQKNPQRDIIIIIIIIMQIKGDGPVND